MKKYLALGMAIYTSIAVFAHAAEQGEEAAMIQVKMSQSCFRADNKPNHTSNLMGWACDKEDNNQKFSFSSKDKQWYQLKHLNSGLCVEVSNGSQSFHVNTVLNECNEQAHQLWKKNPIDDQWFTLSTKHSDGCLDLDHGVKRDGTRLIWQRCLKPSNKRWFDKQAFRLVTE